MGNCTFCLSRGSQEVRYDKRGKPYLICNGCGARSFLRSRAAFRGPTLLSRLIDLIPDERELQRMVDAGIVDPTLKALAAIVSGAAPTPAPVAPTPAPGVAA